MAIPRDLENPLSFIGRNLPDKFERRNQATDALNDLQQGTVIQNLSDVAAMEREKAGNRAAYTNQLIASKIDPNQPIGSQLSNRAAIDRLQMGTNAMGTFSDLGNYFLSYSDPIKGTIGPLTPAQIASPGFDLSKISFSPGPPPSVASAMAGTTTTTRNVYDEDGNLVNVKDKLPGGFPEAPEYPPPDPLIEDTRNTSLLRTDPNANDVVRTQVGEYLKGRGRPAGNFALVGIFRNTTSQVIRIQHEDGTTEDIPVDDPPKNDPTATT